MRNFVKCFLEIEKDGVCLYSIIDIVCNNTLILTAATSLSLYYTIDRAASPNRSIAKHHRSMIFNHG